MKISTFLLAFIFATTASAQEDQRVDLYGLSDPVEIIKDKWGISHIYAKNQNDLFFAQGYNAARDRLFQFEIWRRKATGTLAEIMGEKALAHDKGARLLRFKNDLNAELDHYHTDSREIILSFVAGVNAYIKQTEATPSLLPFEFEMLGIKPGLWTPEIVISRHNALTGGISNEIMLAKAITALGSDKVRDYLPFYRDTHLTGFEDIDLSKVTSDIMDSYRASRSLPNFEASDLKNPTMAAALNEAAQSPKDEFWDNPIEGINNLGSNNWVISGAKTKSGKPIMANDPHRSIQSPSLRYMVHLNAPATDGKKAWDVIGGGEPVLPGVSIGHNQYGAWGLTIFRIDQEDLYVYKTNPDDQNQYWYQGKWVEMFTEETTINVKGQGARVETLKYSVHGPVIFEDHANNLAYGLKAAWLEIGAAPYLASLRMDRATTWQEFRDACSFSGLPGENMIWADKQGTIGWQSVGLTPVRFGWDGSLPIPGDGTYEWAGYVPVKQMPHTENPASGWYGTANNHNVPKGYPNIFSDFYSDPARVYRLREAMQNVSDHTVQDSMALQYDNKSMNAEKMAPFIKALKVSGELKQFQNILNKWDHRLDRDSQAAIIFDIWEQAMINMLYEKIVPKQKQANVNMPSRHKLTEWVSTAPTWVFGDKPTQNRDEMMISALESAIDYLSSKIGNDETKWSYGAIHNSEIIHPLSHLVSPEMRKNIDVAPLPRGGGSNTLNANHGNDRQTSGASFRMIVDTDDWNSAVGTNSPGQSGNPISTHYKDLFENWNKGDYFPMYYTKDKIIENTRTIIRLNPTK